MWSSLQSYADFLSILCRTGSWGTENWNDWPRVISREQGSTGVGTQAVWLPSVLCFPTEKLFWGAEGETIKIHVENKHTKSEWCYKRCFCSRAGGGSKKERRGKEREEWKESERDREQECCGCCSQWELLSTNMDFKWLQPKFCYMQWFAFTIVLGELRK